MPSPPPGDRLNRIRVSLGVWVAICPLWLRRWLVPRVMPGLDYFHRTSVPYDPDDDTRR